MYYTLCFCCKSAVLNAKIGIVWPAAGQWLVADRLRRVNAHYTLLNLVIFHFDMYCMKRSMVIGELASRKLILRIESLSWWLKIWLETLENENLMNWKCYELRYLKSKWLKIKVIENLRHWKSKTLIWAIENLSNWKSKHLKI